MPYRLKASESVAESVRRIAREQVDKTLGELDDPALDVHEKVHQGRKRCKKIRAAVRLVRPALGDAYKPANVHFRDAARLLSGARDATALLETYDLLMNHFADEVDRRAFAPVRGALTRRRADVLEDEQIDDKLAAFRGRMLEAHRLIATWELGEEGYAAVSGGLKKTYRRGREGLAAASEDPSDEKLHDWRKRVKYHRYHLRLLRELWPPVVNPFRHQLHDLTDLLGDDHDLAVFQHTLAAEPDRFRRIASVPALLGLLRRMRSERQAEAWTLGARLFAEKPKALVDRFDTYWAAWQHDAEREGAHVLDAD